MYKVHEPIVCENSVKEIVDSKIYPENGFKSSSQFGIFPEALVDSESGKTKKVYTDGDNLDYFGIDLSEHQIDEINNSSYNPLKPINSKDLPRNIKEIEIKRNEDRFHSMIFYGDTNLHIGKTTTRSDADFEDYNNTHIFEVPEDEQQLGC